MDLITLKKSRIVVGLCLIIAMLASSSMAWGGGRHFGYHYHDFYHHGFYHGYGGWPYYWPYWGAGVTFVAPPIGAVVEYLPDGYTTFVVNGVQYYSCGGYYFRACPSGYVIVSPPEVAASAAPELGSSVTASQAAPSAGAAAKSDGAVVTINIPNANGGFTAVKLTKYKDGYKGPQGEFYQGHPTVDELKALYGK
jgi:hypothetical protein